MPEPNKVTESLPLPFAPQPDTKEVLLLPSVKVALSVVPSRPVKARPMLVLQPVGTMVLAYPDKGSASSSATTDTLKRHPPPSASCNALPSRGAKAPLTRLDPERLPLAATSSETATQVPRTWLYTVR
nr:hypothetical protein [Collimonas pratensis]